MKNLKKGAATISDLKDGASVKGSVGVDGRTFLVDPGASVGYASSTVQYDGVFGDLQTAINQCDNWRGDEIVCKAGTQTVTTAVLFNKQGITVRAEGFGLPLETQGERFMIYGSAVDEPAATISQPCRIIGIGFSSEYGSTGSYIVGVTGTGGWNGGFVEFVGCRFTHWGSTKHDKMLYFNGPGNASFVRHCSFDGLFTSLSVGAIAMADHATGSDAWTLNIEDNYFYNCLYGIVHEASTAPRDCLYKSNRFMSTKILDNNGCTNTGTLVADNWSPYATDATSYDDTVATLQGLGLSFSDNHYEEA